MTVLGGGAEIDARHIEIFDGCAERLRLIAHTIHQFRSENAVRETGVILHGGGVDQLTARRELTRKNGRAIPGACEVDCGRISGRAGTDDDAIVIIFPFFILLKIRAQKVPDKSTFLLSV